MRLESLREGFVVAHLTCPKCRLAVSDAALDTGECPGCGYDGAMVIATSAKGAWLVVTSVVVVAGLALGGYLLIPHPNAPRHLQVPTAIAKNQTQSHAHQRETALAPEPRTLIHDDTPPRPRPPEAAPSPHRPRPKSPGPVILIDPRHEANSTIEMRIANPLAAIAIPDLFGDSRVILTGEASVLKIGTVSSKALLDASGLEVEEILITGDITGSAIVKLHAPGGKVTIGGFVTGSARLTIDAPDGIVIAEKSGRLGGSATATITARDVDLNSPATEGVRVSITFSRGGSLKVAVMEGGADLLQEIARKRPGAED